MTCKFISVFIRASENPILLLFVTGTTDTGEEWNTDRDRQWLYYFLAIDGIILGSFLLFALVICIEPLWTACKFTHSFIIHNRL